MPSRSLRPHEALRLAELQANRLRTLLDVADRPGFDLYLLGALPRVDIKIDKSVTASGSTQWLYGAWRIRINASEPLVRQRFTLAHEFKHLLDAPLLTTTYRDLQSRIDAVQQIEQICDYFAACLLMPKRWVKRLWGEGEHDLALLAGVFDVSTVAMRRRLETLGLVDRQARSATIPLQKSWSYARPIPRRRIFNRLPSTAPVLLEAS